MSDYYILIPPSEGKAAGGSQPPIKKISKETKSIIDRWHKQSRADWQKALGVKDKALDKAMAANKAILTSKTLPAIERYTGVVYDAIDYANLPAKAKTFFDHHVRIVSAVFGLVAPTDLIPDYKMKINNFGADKFWRPVNAKALEGNTVIDLLPQAHQKAVAYNKGSVIGFSLMKGGKKAPAGHQGKHIKGRFIRYVCMQGKINEKVLTGFNEDGFQWNGEEYVKKI